MSDFNLPSKHCLGCYYVLDGLPENRCPECGRTFDPEISSTYTLVPLFNRWRYWLPGLIVAFAGGLVLYVVINYLAGVGVALTLVVPFAIGAIVGYGTRGIGVMLTVVLSICALVGVLASAVSLNLAGLLCALILAVISLIPLMTGVLIGSVLRWRLRKSPYDQRFYLPMVAFLLLPTAWAMFEGSTHPIRPVVVITTSMDIDAPVHDAWNAVAFYEEIHHPPPLLLQLGPKPIRTTGRSLASGDQKVCIYEHGYLTKETIHVEQDRFLGFIVTEQHNIENCTTRLIDGSFAFQSIDPFHTRVTLTTRYQALISPRFCWEPFEHLIAHSLHEHVLKGMKIEAEANASQVKLAKGIAR